MKIVPESIDSFILNEKYNNNSANTNTPQKIREEQKTYDVIKNVMGKPTKWIGLVGRPGEGNFERHVKMCAEIGISSENMIVVERDPAICADLRKENELRKYGCDIDDRDFAKVLEEKLSKGDHFSIVDFDATDNLSKYEVGLLDMFEKYINQIEVLRIVAATREKDVSIFKSISDNLNLKHCYSPRYMNDKYKNIILSQCTIPEIIQEIKNDSNTHHVLRMYMLSYQPVNMIFSEYCKSKKLYCLFENYHGVSPMRNFIISKNEKLLSYKNNFQTFNINTEEIYGHTIEKFEEKGVYFYKIGYQFFRKGFGLIASILKKQDFGVEKNHFQKKK